MTREIAVPNYHYVYNPGGMDWTAVQGPAPIVGPKTEWVKIAAWVWAVPPHIHRDTVAWVWRAQHGLRFIFGEKPLETDQEAISSCEHWLEGPRYARLISPHHWIPASKMEDPRFIPGTLDNLLHAIGSTY